MHNTSLTNSITYMMDMIPPAAVAEAAPDLSQAAQPAAEGSDSVLTRGVDGTSISRSDIMTDEKMIAAKERFYEVLDETGNKKKTKRTKLPSEKEYDEICYVLKEWKVGAPHSSEQAKWHQNYILLKNTSRSSALRWNKNNKNLKVATKEQIFTIIMEVHIALAHAKDTRKIYTEIANTWYGITQEDVSSALQVCPVCMAASHRKITAKQMPLKMILSDTVGSRAQMDLIDMTSQQDDGYCWILRLIDHLSGFGAVKALKSKTSKECGIAIIQILSFFPDFVILQSDNGGEFLGDTIKYVNEHFPDTHLVKGRSRHPQSQGGIERGNAPFKTGLQGYMQEKNTTKWANEGIYVVQRGINKRTSRAKGGHSPYEAFFGKKTKNGPKDILDKHIVEQCLTEAALEAAVAFVQSEEHSMEDRLAPNFNDRIIQVIRLADASFEEDAREESMKPAAVNADAAAAVGSSDAKEGTKLEDNACTTEKDVLMDEEIMKTANDDGIVEVKDEGDEEQTIDEAVDAHTSKHHQSDTPRRGKIRADMAAAQSKQAIAVNKRRKSSTYVEFLQVGDMCKIEVEGNTRAATDYKYLPVKVTACKQQPSKSGMSTITHYQIASRDGYLEGWYPRENLVYDPMCNVKIAGIDTEKEGFLKDLTIARASALYNQSGGATTCGCKKSDCATNKKCICYGSGNFCTSKCHGGRGKNSKCTNCMTVAVDVHNLPSPPPGQTLTPPPGSNNLCAEVSDLQQQPIEHVSTPDNDKKPAANKKAPKHPKRKRDDDDDGMAKVRGGNDGEYEESSSSSSEEDCGETIAAGDEITHWKNMVTGDRFHETTTVVAAVKQSPDRKDFPIIVESGEFISRDQVVRVRNMNAQLKRFTLIPSGDQGTSSVRKASDRFSSIVRSNADAVFGDEDCVEKQMLNLPRKSSTLEEASDNNESIRRRKGLDLAAKLKHMELSPAQLSTVNNAINGTGELHEVLAKSDDGADSVKRESMQRFKSKEQLNDELLNYFLKNCLRRRDEKICNTEGSSQKRSHFFSTFFFRYLFNEKHGNAALQGKYDYSQVKTWYRGVPGKNIFDLKCIYFPANVNDNHWTLTVVFMEEKRIQYYDSYRGKGKGEKYLKGVLRYLEDEHKRQFKEAMDTSEWQLVPCTADTPQQGDRFNCGVFVCLFADFIALGCHPMFDFNLKNLTKCRKWIALAILENCAIDYDYYDSL